MKPDTPIFDTIQPIGCIGSKVRRLNRLLTRIYTQRFQSVGLTPPQVSLIFIIGKNPQIAAKTLSEWLILDASSLSRELSGLIQKGFIRETADDNDKRSRKLSLTETGYQTAEQLAPLWQQQHTLVAELLGGASLAELDRILSVLQQAEKSLRE